MHDTALARKQYEIALTYRPEMDELRAKFAIFLADHCNDVEAAKAQYYTTSREKLASMSHYHFGLLCYIYLNDR